MTEETFWKLLSIATLVIGYLIKALVNSLKKDDKSKVYICPLDKSGVISRLNSISQDIDKGETKLNNIKTTVDYNKIFIENIHGHYTKISESLSNLVNFQKRTIEQNEIQTELLRKISQNGHS